MLSRAIWVVAAVLCAVATTGCSAPAEPWSEEFAAAADAARDASAKEIWEDGDVTYGEYLAAVLEVQHCVERSGVDLTTERVEGIVIFSSPSLADLEVLDQCDASDMGVVRSLYEGRQRDPLGQGSQAPASCLRDEGLLTGKETVDELLQRSETFPDDAQLDIQRCLYNPMSGPSPSG